MPAAMFADVPQNPNAVSQAHLVHPPIPDQQTGWHHTSRRQASADAASKHNGSPRIPDSARLPAQVNEPSSEYLQPSTIPRACVSPREHSEQNLSQTNSLHNEPMESGIRHHGHNSPMHIARDPEMGYSERSSRRASGHNLSQPHHTTIYYEKYDAPEGSAVEAHSIWILIYMSCLSTFLALIFSVYTLLTTTTVLLLLPFCFFCTERKPLGYQIRYFLLPPITFQLGLIYSSISTNRNNSSAFMLVIINLFGPIYAAWIAVSAWVAAAFWAFAAIMGDPDGQDGRDDGRAAVLGVRRWWERWLERAIR